VDNPLWREAWDVVFSLSSALLAVLFGVAVGNVLRGVPLDAEGSFQGSFALLLNPFALLCGVHPKKFHNWHLAMYLDAIDWVSLPNTLGMSQFGDGGIVGSKPYCASGNYIHRMSNFCSHCTFKPDKSVGADACPFTTLYWDFLDRHYARLKKNVRLAYQLHALENKRSQPDQMSAIRRQAADLKKAFA
jgi:deoxyribodipyrimidine photolyase-related protein